MALDSRLIRSTLLTTWILCLPPALAAESSQPPEILDRIWSGNTLYENPDSESFQNFKLVGRYHGQYWSVDADQGNADGWDNRRIIFGFQSKLADEFKIEAQMHVNDSFSPVYNGMYVGFVEWAPREQNLKLNLGRLDYLFAGLERSTSSKKMATFERSALVNQLMPGEVFGLYGKKGFMRGFVQGGIFTGATTEEFGDFDAGAAATAGIAYDLPLFFEKGQLHLDYLYNDGDPNNTGFRPYKDIVTLWHQGHHGPWTVGIDLSAGHDSTDERGNVAGFTLLPTLALGNSLLIGGDGLELALRYHRAWSQKDNGIEVPRRYESEVTSGAGDRYQSAYAGLNYLAYGHKLKFMAGVEYAEMNDSANDGGDYSGWTWLAGIRFYF